MKTEISAGGIIVRKHGSSWQILVVRDMNDALTFPKGKLEKGEKPIDAAKREIREEVGITKITLVKKLSIIRYIYRRNGLISKTVQYFIFKCTGTEPLKLQKEEGIHDAQWMLISKAVDVIGYPETNTPLLGKTIEYLQNLA